MRSPIDIHQALALLAILGLAWLAGCEPGITETPPPDPVASDTVHLAPEITLQDPEEVDRGLSVLMSESDRGLFAYSTTLGDEVYVAVLNRSSEAHSARFPKPAEGHYEVAFLTDEDASHRVQTDATAIMVEIEGHSGMLLRRVDD